jgi:hypothetical protein
MADRGLGEHAVAAGRGLLEARDIDDAVGPPPLMWSGRPRPVDAIGRASAPGAPDG